MLARLILILALLLGPCANAQISLTGAGAGGSVISGGTTYIGPGDVVSGATAWYGLRGYNAAFGTGSNAAINVRRASDNTTSDIDILTNGKLDVATFNTFVGSDGTASCTLAGTTGACTGASGTVHVNDTVTGTGLTQPCIVATASNTAPTIEIAGTTTSCGTVGVAETFTFQVAGFATEAYDQSGNTNHVTQATAGKQPQLLPLCLNSGTRPCLKAVRASPTSLAGSIPSISQPYSLTAVVNATTTAGEDTFFFAGTSTSAINAGIRIFGSNFAVVPVPTLAAADTNPHSFQGIINGTTSVGLIDGTVVTSASGGSVATGTFIVLFDRGGNALDGYWGENGLWPSAFNSTQYGNQHTNMAAYWGTL